MFWRHAALFSNGNPTDPLQISNDEGELLTHYFNGMLDVIPPEARFVDGAEHYSLTATKDQYIKDAFTQQTRAIRFVEPENRAKYRAQHRVGNTIYLDMFAIDQNPKNHWYHKPVNGSRLEHFRLNIEQALTASGEYVWIYGEHAGNLFDWSGNWRKNKPTWESVIPGMTETLLLAKERPDAYDVLVPICGPLKEEYFTDDEIEAIKDKPIFMIWSKADTTVDPTVFELPLIERLEKASATDLHTFNPDDVHDTSGRFTQPDSDDPYVYDGHWSWIYFFNDEAVDADGQGAWSFIAERVQ
jgi:hypothetical protein